jgi:hypothetical protein
LYVPTWDNLLICFRVPVLGTMRADADEFVMKIM